jgi:hypothetical protein
VLSHRCTTNILPSHRYTAHIFLNAVVHRTIRLHADMQLTFLLSTLLSEPHIAVRHLKLMNYGAGKDEKLRAWFVWAEVHLRSTMMKSELSDERLLFTITLTWQRHILLGYVVPCVDCPFILQEPHQSRPNSSDLWLTMLPLQTGNLEQKTNALSSRIDVSRELQMQQKRLFL